MKTSGWGEVLRPGFSRPGFRQRLATVPRRWLWLGGILLAILAIAYAVAFLVDEPMRRYIERQMNARLIGYTVTIHALDFHPLSFAWDLEGLTVVQEANPDPPVADIDRLSASVEWKALLRGKLVANFEVVRPRIHVDLNHLKQEAEDATPVHEKGWQDALQAAYPLKIDEFKIVDGEVTYIEKGSQPPIKLTNVEVDVRNIRNIRSKDREYPSQLHVRARVFETGRLAIDGNADFMAEPHLGVNADIALEQVTLDYLKPVFERYSIVVRKGVLSGRGHVEYASTVKVIELKEATVDGLVADYISRPASAPTQAVKQAAIKAQAAAKAPDILVKINEVKVTRATLGFVNTTTNPDYKVSLTEADIRLTNFSTKRDTTSVATLQGKFMGSGTTVAKATFRPETKGLDFDLALKIENTDLTALNNMLRAYGKFDVVRGAFSFYSELTVKDNRVKGYVKPLFKDMQAYDREQDREKGVVRKLYEKVVGGVAGILDNRPREEVATVASIEGPLGDAKTDVIQVVIRLIQNAFFKAILPGFDAEVGPRDRRARKS